MFFHRLDPRLAPYASSTNFDRARACDRRMELPRGRSYERGVSIVILNLDKPELIGPLTEKLVRDRDRYASRGLGYEVLIGDTGSTDPVVLDLYASVPEFVRVVRGLKYQFSRNNNQVFREHGRYDRVLFLNNDIVAAEESTCFLDMAEHLDEHPRVGVAGLCLWFPDGRVQHAGIDFFRGDHVLRGLCYHPGGHEAWTTADLPRSWRVPAVTGACLMIRSDVFDRIGGFEEEYAVECQDVELCLAADRMGYEIEILNAGHVVHLENATRPKGSESWPDRHLLLRRFGAYVDARWS